MESAQAAALTTLPASVPAFRMAGPPTVRHASTRPAATSCSSTLSAASVNVTAPPMKTSSPRRSITFNSGTR